MNRLKETLWLIKKLFTTKVSKDDQLKFKQMEHYPMKGYYAMMWCGYLISRFDESSINWIIRNHETIHLKHAQVKGSWLKFYIEYLWQWLRGNPIIKPRKSAYYTIPTEMEAYANECDTTYPLNYDSNNIKKYNVKHRKSLFKNICKYGGIRRWKQYLKTL